jgi:hypothetical protein
VARVDDILVDESVLDSVYKSGHMMGYGTIRVSDQARETLRVLARAEGKSMLAVVDEAVETLRRQRFLEQVNAAYARLREDPDGWAEIEAERRYWDITLPDGLVAAERRAAYTTRPRTGKGPRPGRRGKRS